MCQSVKACRQLAAANFAADGKGYVALHLRNVSSRPVYSRTIVRLLSPDGKTVHGTATITGIVDRKSSRFLAGTVDLTPTTITNTRIETITVCSLNRNKSRVIPAVPQADPASSCVETGSRICGILMFTVPLGWEVPAYSNVHMALLDSSGQLIGGCLTTNDTAMAGGFSTPLEYLGWSCPSPSALPTGWSVVASSFMNR